MRAKALADIEKRAKTDKQATLMQELLAMELHGTRRNKMQRDVKGLRVPLSYRDERYNPRVHIDLIKRPL
ncbi:MAG: hypothetical protein JKY92_04995 [Magnetovibrio sp.]|nr:hypothetical protein [Magnetovibrio sp.]